MVLKCFPVLIFFIPSISEEYTVLSRWVPLCVIYHFMLPCVSFHVTLCLPAVLHCIHVCIALCHLGTCIWSSGVHVAILPNSLVLREILAGEVNTQTHTHTHTHTCTGTHTHTHIHICINSNKQTIWQESWQQGWQHMKCSDSRRNKNADSRFENNRKF